MALETNVLLQYLSNVGDWVESKILADAFRVSTRTIRTYIKKINTAGNGDLILSSYKGYRLNDNIRIQDVQLCEDPEKRGDYIIRKLLCCNNVDFFDLADELYISDSTMELELRKCRDTLRQYHLVIQKRRKSLSLQGSERDKRKLMNVLIGKENVNDFISSYNEMLNDVIDLDYLKLCQQLHQIFITEGLFVNEYELNTIAVHVMVAVTRIHADQTIQDDVDLIEFKNSNTHAYHASIMIQQMLKEVYNVVLNQSEIYYLILLISSNSNRLDNSFINMNNISQYIEETYIQISRTLIQHLSEAYHLDDFDEQFFIKFSIHVKNLCYRLHHDVNSHNPLSIKIKKEYPLVYDMAVFLAKELQTIGYEIISDDEIAFLAFHIGAYLENDKNRREHCSCCFIYTDYHDMHQRSLDIIQKQFGNRLHINKILPFRYADQIENCDFVITMTDISSYTSLPTITIGPFLSDKDIKAIEDILNEIDTGNKRKLICRNLHKFVGEQLFFRELYKDSIEEIISFLCENCRELDLCDETYVDKVLERENMSSTSFPNHVAVPHSLLRNAKHSFLSVIVNERKMKWKDFDVNLIILIGFGKDDHEIFTTLFDRLIAALYEKHNVNRLLTCKYYGAFIQELENILNESS